MFTKKYWKYLSFKKIVNALIKYDRKKILLSYHGKKMLNY